MMEPFEFDPPPPPETRAVWSSLKSQFYLCHKDWQRSGMMDPLAFPTYIKGKWHLLYLWKKYQDKPEMINFITRQIPEGAVVDTQDLSRDNIADRAQAVIERAPRRNTKAPVAVVRVPTAATPSTITMATAKKKDSAHAWLDSFSSDLLKAFSRDRDADDEDKTKKKKRYDDGEKKAELLALRKERHECWKQCTEFEDQLERMAPGERKNLVQGRLTAENKALLETEAEMEELGRAIAGKPNKKPKESHEEAVSVGDESSEEHDNNHRGKEKHVDEKKPVDKKNKHLGQEDDDSEEDDETSDPDTPERMKERRKKNLPKCLHWAKYSTGSRQTKPCSIERQWDPSFWKSSPRIMVKKYGCDTIFQQIPP